MNLTLWNDEQHRPLQHIRVLDMSVMLPGPYLTRILAQYGADVVKVEHLPKGDPLRELPDSTIFELLNQGKRSIGVDLKTNDGKAIIKQLVEEADLFVENFREGVMDQMGLGYADISEVNPDLLYLSLRGLSGKNTPRTGHDLNFISTSGVGEWFLENDQPNYSTHFGDIVGGTLAPAIKLLVHLANPARRGMHLVCHMDEGFRTLFLPRAYESVRSASDGKATTHQGYFTHLNGTQPHSRYYRCRDKQWIALNAIQEKHWKLFCEVVDKKEWASRADDPTLTPELEALFRDAPASYWEALAGKREVCLFRVIPWEEHVNYSQARPQLSTDPLTWCGFAPNLQLHKSPELGRDSFTVLHAIGATNKEIAELVDRGIIHQPKS